MHWDVIPSSGLSVLVPVDSCITLGVLRAYEGGGRG